MIAPIFDEESFVRDVQIELGFEHELLAQKILEVARVHYVDALSRFAEIFVESAADELRGSVVHLMAQALRPQEIKEEDATKQW